MPFGLTEKTIETVQGILAKHPKISKAMLYGSRAKGTYRNGSDVDLTLKGEELTASNAWGIATAFEDTSLPYSFDISIFDEISNPGLVDHINRVGIVFYERNNGKTRETR